MKKIIALALASMLTIVSFVGCGKELKPQVPINSAEELNGLAIGCQESTTGETWVLDNCKDKAPTSYKTGMEAAMDLKNAKLDAVVLDELPAKSIVAKNPELKILDIKFTKEKYAIAVAKGNTELVEKINATIKRMKDDGTYEELNNAFVPADGKIKVPEELVSEGTDVLKMGTNAEFPPFEYVDGDKIVGFDISMCQNIAFDAKAKLEISNMPFGSLIAALQSGTIDMIAAGMSVNEERLKSVDFSDTYYESEQVIIVRK